VSDPVVVYSGLTVACPPLTGVAGVSVNIPDSMWNTWYVPNAQLTTTDQGPAYIPNAIIQFGNIVGPPPFPWLRQVFLITDPHGLATTSITLDGPSDAPLIGSTLVMNGQPVNAGVPDSQKVFFDPPIATFPSANQLAYTFSIIGGAFPQAYVTSQHLTVHLQANTTQGSGNVTIQNLNLAFIDKPNVVGTPPPPPLPFGLQSWGSFDIWGFAYETNFTYGAAVQNGRQSNAVIIG
jgi:hypothetical protein